MNSHKFQAKVFNTAWTILHAGHAPSISVALKKAWTIARIASGTPTYITFAKQDTGEVRDAVALITGDLSTIADGFVRFVEIKGGRSQWRSFRIDHLITN